MDAVEISVIVIGSFVIGSCIVIPYVIMMICANRKKKERRRQENSNSNTIHQAIHNSTHRESVRNITPLTITTTTSTRLSTSTSTSTCTSALQQLPSSSTNDMFHEFCNYIYDYRQCTVPTPAGHDTGIHRQKHHDYDHHEEYHYDFPDTTPMKLSNISHDDTIGEINIKENNRSQHRTQQQHSHIATTSPPLFMRNMYA